MAPQYSPTTVFMLSGVGSEGLSLDVKTPWIMIVTDSCGRTENLPIRYGPN